MLRAVGLDGVQRGADGDAWVLRLEGELRDDKRSLEARSDSFAIPLFLHTSTACLDPSFQFSSVLSSTDPSKGHRANPDPRSSLIFFPAGLYKKVPPDSVEGSCRCQLCPQGAANFSLYVS